MSDERLLAELEGDKARYFDDDLGKAISFYKEALLVDKYRGLMYELKSWADLKDDLGETQVPIEMALIIACDLNLGIDLSLAWPVNEFKEIVQNCQSISGTNKTLHESLGSMHEFLKDLKSKYLAKYPRTNNDLDKLLRNHFEFFGWSDLLSLMKKVADDYPSKYIKFIDENKPHDYRVKQDGKYTASLEKVRDQLSGDEKIDFIKDHIRWVTPDKKEEWNRVHATELDLKITELPEKGFSSTINDVPSFLVNDENNPTSKLFMLLDEIHGLIGQSAFNNDYSRRIELIIQARNETHVISQFQKFVKHSHSVIEKVN